MCVRDIQALLGKLVPQPTDLPTMPHRARGQPPRDAARRQRLSLVGDFKQKVAGLEIVQRAQKGPSISEVRPVVRRPKLIQTAHSIPGFHNPITPFDKQVEICSALLRNAFLPAYVEKASIRVLLIC